jgi:hypothetical protein
MLPVDAILQSPQRTFASVPLELECSRRKASQHVSDFPRFAGISLKYTEDLAHAALRRAPPQPRRVT